MSFLEMIDVLNERLITEGKGSDAFDHDCREGYLRYLFHVYQWTAAWSLACTIPPVSCTCGLIKMVIPLRSNPGGQMLFL